MKKLCITTICMVLLIIVSCSRDEQVPLEESNLIELQKKRESNNVSSKMSCSILAAVVEGDWCQNTSGSMGRLYTTYASSGTNQVAYDRQVEIYIVDSSQNTVETKLVVIPAFDNVSNSVGIFVNEEGESPIGDVTVKVANVMNLSTGQFDYSCSFTDTTYNIQNCYFDEMDDTGVGLGIKEK